MKKEAYPKDLYSTSQALKHAVYPYKLIDKNPCQRVNAPSPKQAEIYPLSQKNLINYLKILKMSSLFILLYI